MLLRASLPHAYPPTGGRSPWLTRRHLPELLIVFALGVTLMQFFYSATPDAGRGLPANVPGNDSFYHVKMALLLPHLGLPDEFPWLRHTIFEHDFISHHYGFHAYLAPFVRLFDNPLIGARWAMSILFGGVFAAAYLILISEGVAVRWLWLAVLVALPTEFYSRLTYVRAIDLSLLCMLLGCLLMFRRRYVAFAAVMIVYTHVYLGAFFLAILAVIHYISGWLGPRRLRDTWRLPLATAAGGALGLLTHPYNFKVIGFLWTQIFGSGLTPEVSVGREWDSYEDVWPFANLIGIPLSALAIAIALRFRCGRRLNANEWTMLIASFFFLALVFKARRFIEYFPMFAVLAAAMISAPVFGREDVRPVERAALRRPDGVDFAILGLTLVMAVSAWLGWWWTAGPPAPPQSQGCLTLDAWRLFWESRSGIEKSWLAIAAVLAGLYTAAAAWKRWGIYRRAETRGRWSVMTVASVLTAVAVVGVLARVAFPLHDTVRGWCRGRYDLKRIEAAMTFLKDRSRPGDVVFTDDWDVFPIYFFYNDKNHYMAGLDPMFSYRFDPELWERYCLITQGKAPITTKVSLTETDESGRRKLVERQIHVELEDIRDRWGARFIVVDSDHRAFSRKLDRAAGLAVRIYPDGADAKEDPELAIYEVLPAPAPASPGATDQEMP